MALASVSGKTKTARDDSAAQAKPDGNLVNHIGLLFTADEAGGL